MRPNENGDAAIGLNSRPDPQGFLNPNARVIELAHGAGFAKRGVGKVFLRQLALSGEEVQAAAAGDPCQELVRPTGLNVELCRHADQSHQGTRTPGPPRQPGVNPRVKLTRKSSCVSEGNHQHICFGCSLNRDFKDTGTRQVADEPAIVAHGPIAN
jgi:hypothetical protein